MSKKQKLIPELRFPEFKNDGEWELKTIGDVANSESSSMALNKLDLKPTGYPVYGADSIVGYIDEFQHKEKYISIVKDGSGVGRLNLCQSNSSILGTLTSLKSKNKKQYDLDWLYYLLNTVDFSVYVKGAGIPHIYYSDFKNENVPVPTPKEQQKIASCLSSLDDLITAHSQKLDLLKDHKKGLMQNLFPQQGEKVPKLRFKEFEKDGEWVEKKLGELLEFKNGINAAKEQYGKGIKFINVLDVLKDEVITYDSIIGSVDIDEITLQKNSVKFGDIIFQRSSETQEEVGTANVYLDKDNTATFGGFVIRGKKIGSYEPLYLNALLKTKEIRNSISLKAGGITRFNVSQEILASTTILLPTIQEQQKIASCLSSLDEIIKAQAEKIVELKQHKKGLMQGLFPKMSAL